MLKNALSAKAVASFKNGKHRDGEGLQFEVKGGSRRWTFSYMFEGRQRELAIGKYPAMSLAEARAKRAELREAKDRGIDPRRALAGATVAPIHATAFCVSCPACQALFSRDRRCHGGSCPASMPSCGNAQRRQHACWNYCC